MTHRKREGGLKILSGKDFKAEHIVPGNVYRLEKRKFWLSLPYSVATWHAYWKYTKRGEKKIPFEEELGRRQKECSSAHFTVPKLTPSWLHKAHSCLSPTNISKRNKCQSKSQRSEHEEYTLTTVFRAIPFIYCTLYRCQRRQCSSLEMLAMSGRWSSYRETIFRVVVGEGGFLFLQIEEVHNNQ